MSETVVFTFHKIREQAEQGDAGAWAASLDFYAPALLHLLEIQGATDSREAAAVLKRTLAELTAGGFARFRTTPRQSEREFLGDIRALLLEAAADSAAAPDSATFTQGGFAGETITKLLEGLPLLHKEMLFFKLAGYTDATLERLLRVSPRVAEKTFERLKENHGAAVSGERDRCPWPREWLAFVKQVRAVKTDQCVPAHQSVRIHDGQVSWYDKEPVERHVSSCLHCLEAWTGLREVAYWRHAARKLSTSEIEQLMEGLPVEERRVKKESFFQRLRRNNSKARWVIRC